MSRLRFPSALAAVLLTAGFAGSAVAQGTVPACSQPFDPTCNHLKCYAIKDRLLTPVTLQVDNQFGREKLVLAQAVLLCLPTQKSCCNAAGCSPSNCAANPVPAPPLPHFKCYKIKGKTACTASDPTCATIATFPKKTIQVNLRDQFGLEGPLPVLAPKLFCTPVDKQVVGGPTTTTTQRPPTSTTTTSTTTTTTTTTIQFCHNDTASPTGCSGPCPPTAPAGSQCTKLPSGKCDCVAPPVCCECAPGTPCFNTNGQCPTNCSTVPNATCNTTGHCSCGFCSDGACTGTPCSTSQPCPTGQFCDPINCPAPCDPCAQGGTCTAVPCLRSDGTNSQCRLTGPVPGQVCSCCGQPGAFCTSNGDCCSPLTCNAAGTCQ